MNFSEIQKAIRDRDRNAESQSLEDVIQEAINRRTGLPRHVRDLAEAMGVDPSDAGDEITATAQHARALAIEHGADPDAFEDYAMNRLHAEAIAPHLDDRSIQSAGRVMLAVRDRVAQGIHADTEDTPQGKSRSTQSVIRDQVNLVKEMAGVSSGSDESSAAGDVGASETGSVTIR